MKALVGAFNQEKVLVGAFSVIVQPVMEPMEQSQHYLAPRLVTAFPLVLVVRTRVGPQVQHWAETVATITMDSKWILLIASLAGDGVLS